MVVDETRRTEMISGADSYILAFHYKNKIKGNSLTYRKRLELQSKRKATA